MKHALLETLSGPAIAIGLTVKAVVVAVDRRAHAVLIDMVQAAKA